MRRTRLITGSTGTEGPNCSLTSGSGAVSSRHDAAGEAMFHPAGSELMTGQRDCRCWRDCHGRGRPAWLFNRD